jgi:hypothetical protein
MARSSPDPDHTADDTVPPDPAPVPPEPPADPVPVPAPEPPDPERIPPLSLLVLGDIVTLFELLADSPTGHSLAVRTVALRRDYDLLMFHSKPPEKK